MGLAGHVAHITESIAHTNIFVAQLMGTNPLGRPSLRLEGNITTDLEEVGFGVWIGLMWLRIGTGGGLL